MSEVSKGLVSEFNSPAALLGSQTRDEIEECRQSRAHRGITAETHDQRPSCIDREGVCMRMHAAVFWNFA